MKQKCFYCGKEIEVGEALIPYGVICDECAAKESFDYPADWEKEEDGTTEMVREGTESGTEGD